jgi:hypothetical protein
MDALRYATMDPKEHRDEEARRLFKVNIQKSEGRTGGGPECPNCGERALVPMPNSVHRGTLQCRECGNGVVVYVGGKGSGGGLMILTMERRAQGGSL